MDTYSLNIYICFMNSTHTANITAVETRLEVSLLCLGNPFMHPVSRTKTNKLKEFSLWPNSNESASGRRVFTLL